MVNHGMIKKIATCLLLLLLNANAAYAGVPMLQGEASLENDLLEGVHLTKLMKASVYGDVKKINAILTKGVDVNERSRQGETALMFAARYARPEVVQLLLNHHAKPNLQTTDGKNTALLFACTYTSGDEIGVWLHLDPNGPGPELSPDKQKKLTQRILEGRKQVVRLLLKHGADPNLLPAVRDGLGNPPALGAAVQAGNIEIVRLLLNHHAKLRNSLEEAVIGKRADIVKLLLGHGATVRRNITRLEYVQSVASPEINQLLNLDQYNLLGKSDEIYPDSLDELAQDGEVVSKLYRNPKLNLASYPETGRMWNVFTYLDAKVIRNTIFARHNYAFDTVWLRNYFKKNFPDYQPKSKKVVLTRTDKRNLTFANYLESQTIDQQ